MSQKKTESSQVERMPLVRIEAEGTQELCGLVAIISTGLCHAIAQGAVTAEYACARFFCPMLSTILRRSGASAALIEAIELSLELEDVEQLIPEQLEASALKDERMFLEILENLTQTQDSSKDQTGWSLWVPGDKNDHLHQEDSQRSYLIKGETGRILKIEANGKPEIQALFSIVAIGLYRGVITRKVSARLACRYISQAGMIDCVDSMHMEHSLLEAYRLCAQPEDTRRFSSQDPIGLTNEALRKLLRVLTILPLSVEGTDKWLK